MAYQLKSYVATDGEHFSLLFKTEEPGFPLFYPTAFVARSIRMSTQHETQKDYLEAIKRVCEWEELRGIDLVTTFQRRNYLAANEIDSLANYLRRSRLNKKKTIGINKGNNYISYAAKYLKWLAIDVIKDSACADVLAELKNQYRLLTGKRSPKRGSASAAAQIIISSHLSDEMRNELLDLFEAPYSFVYHKSDKASRLRNVVMLRILYDTGMRRGELLSLKLKHFIESSGGTHASLVIERNHHDEVDDRLQQPVAKTAGRIVPIPEETEKQLLEYISTARAEMPGVGFSEEDFIFVNHRRGKNQGRPLTLSGFTQALKHLKECFNALALLHFHLLRHDWNYRYSKVVDETGISSENEKEWRAILMGWSPHSTMAKVYNQRHVQEQALLAGLKVANHSKRKQIVPGAKQVEEATASALALINSKVT